MGNNSTTIYAYNVTRKERFRRIEHVFPDTHTEAMEMILKYVPLWKKTDIIIYGLYSYTKTRRHWPHGLEDIEGPFIYREYPLFRFKDYVEVPMFD